MLSCAFTTGKIEVKSDGSPWRPVLHILDLVSAIEESIKAPNECFQKFSLPNSTINTARFVLNCNYSILELSKESLFSKNYNNLGESINSQLSEYLPYISVNGKELIFTRVIKYYDSSGSLKSHEDLYLSYKLRTF